MSVPMHSTSRLQFILPSKVTSVHKAPAREKASVVGSVVRRAVVLLALVALAGLAVFALLPVGPFGVLFLLSGLPLLLILSCLLGDSAEATALTAGPTGTGAFS